MACTKCITRPHESDLIMGVYRDDLFAPFDTYFNEITYNQALIPIIGLAVPFDILAVSSDTI